MKVRNGILTDVNENDLELLKSNPDKFWKDVVIIGKNCFSRVHSLDHLDIPEGILEIHKEAFYSCPINSITLPSSLVYIGEDAFSHCSYLEDITIPKKVKNIGEGAFYSCENLTNIKLHNGISHIGNSAFAETKIEQIKLPTKLEYLGSCAFYGCNNLKSITIPNSITTICENTFSNCDSLEKVILPDGLTSIEESAFNTCISLTDINLPDSISKIGGWAFEDCSKLNITKLPSNLTTLEDGVFLHTQTKSIKIPPSVKKIKGSALCNNLRVVEIPATVENISSNAINELDKYTLHYAENGDICLTYNRTTTNTAPRYKISRPFSNSSLLSQSHRINVTWCYKHKDKGDISFIPKDFILKNFTAGEIENFFINNNHHKWRSLLTQLQTIISKYYPSNTDEENINTYIDIFKIYYALGGFSRSQAERDRAYEYVSEHIINTSRPQMLSYQIHERFNNLNTSKVGYQPTFAQFFMKYYHENNDFMRFSSDEGIYSYEQDFIASAYNNWRNLTNRYPNRVVNGNEERALLTPEFVAKHCNLVIYDNDVINEGNEELASLIGQYGYSQEQFQEIQDVYNVAKKIKDKYVIKADKSKNSGCIQFRLLEKDDPLGFVLGDITNCCQTWNGVAKSCVDDGYRNPNAGFIVFEDDILDKNGQPTGEKRVLGQAYIWYDPTTQTVCYDNIEIPTKILKELFSGEKHNKTISVSELLKAVENSAEAIMIEMNRSGTPVKKVTTGSGYNDLSKEFKKHKLETSNLAQHRGYGGYSDAKNAQYVIKTFDKLSRTDQEKSSRQSRNNTEQYPLSPDTTPEYHQNNATPNTNMPTRPDSNIMSYIRRFFTRNKTTKHIDNNQNTNNDEQTLE